MNVCLAPWCLCASVTSHYNILYSADMLFNILMTSLCELYEHLKSNPSSIVHVLVLILSLLLLLLLLLVVVLVLLPIRYVHFTSEYLCYFWDSMLYQIKTTALVLNPPSDKNNTMRIFYWFMVWLLQSQQILVLKTK